MKSYTFSYWWLPNDGKWQRHVETIRADSAEQAQKIARVSCDRFERSMHHSLVEGDGVGVYLPSKVKKQKNTNAWKQSRYWQRV